MTAEIADAVRPARSGIRGLLAPAPATLVAFALLIGLGLWQLERLQWKTALLATIAARTTAPPLPLPPEPAWSSLKPEDYAYRHVVVAGTFEHDKESHVFRPLPEGTNKGPFGGLGDLVMTPLRLASGAYVIVNRGFVPQDRLDPATRREGQLEGAVTVTGLMREPESRNLFTPADDPGHGIWFTRDPNAIAAYLRLADVAPFTIDADATALPGGLPQGGETVMAIPNNHLSYALTWFGLAIGLLGVFAAFAWKKLHGDAPLGHPVSGREE